MEVALEENRGKVVDENEQEEEEEEEEIEVGERLQRKSRSCVEGNGSVGIVEVVEEESGEQNGRVGGKEDAGDEHQSNVYFDENQGIWKCRRCFWTCPGAIDVKTSPFKYELLYDSHIKGVNSTVGFSTVNEFLHNESVEKGEADFTPFSTVDTNAPPLHSDLYLENPKLEIPPSFFVTSHSFNANERFESSSKEATPAKSRNTLIEVDLERVLVEQDTHDLYCPNCNSCITKRVILRKRKRTIQEHNEVKRKTIQPVQVDLLTTSGAAESATASQEDEEPNVFRCLSCFSFFIPTERGFKLFSFRKRESESLQSAQPEHARHSNWIWSLFGSINWKSKEDESDAGNLASETSQGRRTTKQLEVHEEVLQSMETRNGVNPMYMFPSDKEEGHEPLPCAPPIGVEYPCPTKSEVSQMIMLGSGSGDRASGSSQSKKEEVKDVKEEDLQENNAELDDATIQQVPKKTINLLNPYLFFKKTSQHEETNEQDLFSLNQSVLPPRIAIDKNKGEGIVSISEDITEHAQQGLSSTIDSSRQDIHVPTPPTHIEIPIYHIEPSVTDAGRTRDWDILKAIVYGGLVESITSLGVVSSAAGANASTLNIVALGLANLIGGLLLIINNLLELHDEEYQSLDQNDGHASRYWKVLGRRGHFGLHATVALLSFIIVGILPPAIYGFTFRKSDNKEYKLMAIAAASLLCVALLSIGKAHVQRVHKPYIKYLFYYIGLGVSASGLSYVAGALIQKLLQSLGVFDGGSTVIPSPPSIELPELKSAIPSWASY